MLDERGKINDTYVSEFLERTGLRDVSMQSAQSAYRRYLEILTEAFPADLQFTEEEATKLTRYEVPPLSVDGACSLLGANVTPEVYDLNGILGGDKLQNARLVAGLQFILASANSKIHADWIGIYKRHEVANREPFLLKLGYIGNISRAEFPLTSDFAERSNNSTVGLSGIAVVVHNVEDHCAGGNPYYVCDTSVQSEVCVPIFDKNFQIVGIIDAESFNRSFFDSGKKAELVGLSLALGEVLSVEISKGD